MELGRFKSFSFSILALWMLSTSTLLTPVQCIRGHDHAGGVPASESKYMATACRAHTASISDFGGVGDGVTSNTKAFSDAVSSLSQYASDGGGMLFVPAGRWLTGPFNLTSHFTLFLDQDAVILASQDLSEWPVIDPLPSYGRGRDGPGGRYSSLLSGSNLTDVIITGNNGTVDGQGAFWWQKFHSKKLKFTRGYLVELMFSDQILISNLTFLNSPAWNIHPVYSSNILVSGITILAPVRSPNTDGINPDSCSHVRIEDCYIVSGDDCVAIKSGWDEYGIAFGMPSEHIVIRRLTCISPYSATIALGSEMSGGIRDVRAEDITALNTESAVRIKTAPGRGAYVKDIFVRGMNLNTMKWVFLMTGSYKSHPDGHYDPNAMPVVDQINYRDVVATNVSMAGRLQGISNASFTGICFSNVTVHMAVKAKKLPWLCTDIAGVSNSVSPAACAALADQGGAATACPFPEDRLPMDDVELKECSYPRSTR
ncbi:putative polygalacturonase [Iris pallida]|uniref:Polygalacturonase n=1 Tax=Iris pallida TaxID=29817 RepID=A0AAX6DZU1_IRIPA|nr:putative polygalacturonase [Iris pallida]